MLYSQIIWALILGAAFFNEFPDGLALFGLAVIVIAGVAGVFADGTQELGLPHTVRVGGRFPGSARAAARRIDRAVVPGRVLPLGPRTGCWRHRQKPQRARTGRHSA